MSTSIQFGPADRDERGFVKVAAPPDEPRSLADLLPTPGAIQADAQRAPAPTRIEQALLLIAALIMIGAVAWRLGWSGEAPPPRPAATPATAQARGEMIAAPSPPPAPTPAMRAAYRAPDVPLGPIEATRVITPVAHFGDDWIQADVQGSGLIWLRASDWPRLTIVGPDLAPRPTPIYVAPPPTDPPPPPPCARVGVEGKMVQVCDYDSLEALQSRAKAQWIATYGGNVGIVSTPSPQEWNRP